MVCSDTQIPRRSEVRWHRRFAISILAGLTITLAATWGLALRYPADTTVPHTAYGCRVLRPSVLRTIGRNIETQVWRRPGTVHYFSSIGPGWGNDVRDPLPETVVAPWAVPHVLPWSVDLEAAGFEHPTESRHVIAYGWPLPSLWCQLNINTHPNGNLRASAEGGVILSSDRTLARYSLRFPPTLPLRPYWPGFVANTLLTSAVCLVILMGWAAVRSRLIIPPGHCRRCRYDLRANVSPVCPECGNPAPTSTPTPIAPTPTP